jgi:hypothetical protein
VSGHLRLLVPLHEQPGMADAIANVIANGRGKVCSVCGLGQMGHGPQSGWLGFERHPWDAVPADDAALKRADELTVAAYRARP